MIKGCLRLSFVALLSVSLYAPSAPDTGLAPEVTDLNAPDVSFAKEKELPEGKSPKDRVGGRQRVNVRVIRGL